MAKEYNVGDRLYLPVWVTAMESDVAVKPNGTEVKTDARFAYTYAYGESRREGYVRYGQPDRLLTAEEVAENVDLIARSTLEEYTEKAEKRIRNLEQQLADAKENLSDAQAQVKELTEADCKRVQEFKPIIEERDRLKGELEQEKKRTQVWKDSSEEHRQRAEELEGDVRRYEQDISEAEVTVQKLTKENDSLKADILELKAQLDVFRPDSKEIEALKKRINMLEKLKEVHVRVIRRSTRQLKEKDFMISALVKKGIELEEGGKQ